MVSHYPYEKLGDSQGVRPLFAILRQSHVQRSRTVATALLTGAEVLALNGQLAMNRPELATSPWPNCYTDLTRKLPPTSE